MKVKTFPGGIHPAYHKGATSGKAIEPGPLPDEIVLPLRQHLGKICEPLVRVEERVLVGQRIADADVPVSAPIHSPVSGEVVAIEARPHHLGLKMLSIVIKPDGEQVRVERPKPPVNPDPDEIRRLVGEAGIVGLGGAAFPTGVKLTPPKEARIDSVIINGCECEPYLTADHRLMVENPDDIIDGLKSIMKTVGADRGFVGVETNKPDAIETLVVLTRNEPAVEIVPLEVKYPQGSEKHLIKAVLDREVPSKALPSRVGALVQNVATTIAIARAVRFGEPLTQKVMTVGGGGVREPKNPRVYIGTPIKDVIAAAGGLSDDTAKIILGGPMMGVTIADTEAPVVKAASGIIALTAAEIDDSVTQPCIKCGRCVQVCPMDLVPNHVANLVQFEIWDELDEADIMDCVECGSCAFICPSKRPLVHLIKIGKYRLALETRREKS